MAVPSVLLIRLSSLSCVNRKCMMLNHFDLKHLSGFFFLGCSLTRYFTANTNRWINTESAFISFWKKAVTPDNVLPEYPRLTINALFLLFLNLLYINLSVDSKNIPSENLLTLDYWSCFHNS